MHAKISFQGVATKKLACDCAILLPCLDSQSVSQATVIPRRSGIDLLNFLFDSSASSDACLLDLRNSSGLKFVQSSMFCFQMFEISREAVLFIFPRRAW